jgi:hypothetical protein
MTQNELMAGEHAATAATPALLGSSATSVPDYRAFLESKVRFTQYHGFDVDPADLNPALKPFTHDVVRWAAKGGRRALFLAFGLHKTVTQLELMRVIGRHDPAALRLIVLPLGVRQEFKRDAAERFTGRHAVELRFIRGADEIDWPDTDLPDELRDGARRQARPGDLFTAWQPRRSRRAAQLRVEDVSGVPDAVRRRAVPLRRHGDAEPESVQGADPLRRLPGRHGHRPGADAVLPARQHAGEQPDAVPAQGSRVLPAGCIRGRCSCRSRATWATATTATCCRRCGSTTTSCRRRSIDAKADRDGQFSLVRDAALGLADAATEKRESIDERVAKAARDPRAEPRRTRSSGTTSRPSATPSRPLCRPPSRSSARWTSTSARTGSSSSATADSQYLATKPSISGAGCNFQRHCSLAVFTGIGYEFHDFVQSCTASSASASSRPARST